MGILDKLIEKKNILSYIERRVKQLRKEEDRAVKEADLENRESIRQRFKGRIRELKKMKEIANNKRFAKKSKDIQEKLSERGCR